MNRVQVIASCFYLLLCLFNQSQAKASEVSITLAGRNVMMWRPNDTTRLPLIIFSHGFQGCATQSRFLMQYLADQGYWVLAPNHKDARCNSEKLISGNVPEPNFREPQSWDSDKFKDRHDDIVAILDSVKKQEFAQNIDFDHIGLIGHSLGGYTVLGMAGAWKEWQIDGIDAVLALSPYTAPYNINKTLGLLRVPVMYQGGTRDLGITPGIKRKGGSYDQSPKPKYFIELERAGHFAWTDLSTEGVHDTINHYAIEFLDYYLKDGAAPPSLGLGVTEFWADTNEVSIKGPAATETKNPWAFREKLKERVKLQ